MYYGRDYLAVDKSVVETSIDRAKNDFGPVVASFTSNNKTLFGATIHVKKDFISDLMCAVRMLLEGHFVETLGKMIDMFAGRTSMYSLIGSRNVHRNPIFKHVDPVVTAALKSTDITIAAWDPRSDKLTMSSEYYDDLGIVPVAITDQRKVKMIYFEPYNGGNVV